MKLKWYHRVRLIRLADKLEGKGPYAAVGPVPAHKFDMLNVAQEHRGGLGISTDKFNPKKCKTAACALGWAFSDRWFQRTGLDFGVDNETWQYLFQAYSYIDQGGRLVAPAVVATRLREVAARP